MAWFDFRHQRILDLHSVLVLGLAVINSFLAPFHSVTQMILGAFIGGVSLELFRRVYRVLRQRDGLGYGDVKFLAASGAWTGPLVIPHLILIASVSALLFVVLRSVAGRKLTSASRIAFGPHLAVGLVCTIILLRFGYL
jgi:leader peptidase (prepilin peptidase) / N-methyltransferase